jgi:hypothetical protein
MSKCDCVELNRRWDDLSGPQTISKISHFARGERDRASTFTDVLDLLSSVISGAPFRHRVCQRHQT